MTTLETMDKQWLNNIRTLVIKTLAPTITKGNPPVTDTELLTKFVDRDNMLIWAKAFTHESFDKKFNNEDLEFQGDVMLQSVFPKFLMLKFPQFHKKQYTFFNTHYMSGAEHYIYSKILGFDKNYIRMAKDLSYNRAANADVFEAFVGALDVVAEKVQPGSGYTRCANFIFWLFKDFKFNMDVANGNPVMQMQQMFSRFKNTDVVPNYYGDIKIDVNQTYDQNGELKGYIGTITLDPTQIQLLQKLGVKLTQTAFRGKESSTEKFAKRNAYQAMYEYFQSGGINSEWITKARRWVTFSAPELQPFVAAANNRAEAAGYKYIDFDKPAKTSNSKSANIILYGVDKDDDENTLGTVVSSDDTRSYMSAKIALLQSYADPNTVVPFFRTQLTK